MKREEVYGAIDSERDYQVERWGERPHSNVEFLVYMRDYLEEALHVYSRRDDLDAHQFCQDNIRKIAALAVAAMEQNGARNRE